MLVLSRKEGETIVIDGRIRVQVARIAGGRVRLAIDAPPNVAVDRWEVWREKSLSITENLQASQPAQTNDEC